MLVTSVKMPRGREGQTQATIDATGFPARNEKTPPEALADPYVDVHVCLYYSFGGGMRDRGEREALQG